MAALRKVTFRMYPNAAQTERLEERLGLHQRVYNTALEARIRAYREHGESLNFASQCKDLTKWRASCLALAEVNAQSLQVTLKRLDLAFQAFFRRVKTGEAPASRDSSRCNVSAAGATTPTATAGVCMPEKR